MEKLGTKTLKTVALALALAISPLAVSAQPNASQVASQPAPSSQLVQSLEKLYEKYPAARNVVDAKRLSDLANATLPELAARQVVRSFRRDKEAFSIAREVAIAAKPAPANGKMIVISGLSASGMFAAIAAAKEGYNVVAFEQRDKYTRNIQWTGRQCLLDTMALLDKKLSDDFLRTQTKTLVPENDLVNGKVELVVPLREAKPGVAARTPMEPGEMLNADTVMVVETKKIEAFLMEYLKTLPNVKIRVKEKMVVTAVADKPGHFAVDGVGEPHMIVVAEGSGSATRKALSIPYAATSPERTQIAGELAIPREKQGHTFFNENHVTYADGTKDILLTSALSNGESERNWSVTDVPKDLKLDSPEAVKEYYRRALGAVLQTPASEISYEALSGPIEKFPPTVFKLQQSQSSTAVYGSNMVAIGDTVGNAHWNVGGGVHIAAVTHVIRFNHLLMDLDSGRASKDALKEYNAMALKDSMEWGRRGVVDFYPEKDPESIRKLFDEKVHAWIHDPAHAPKPLDAIEAALKSVPARELPKAHPSHAVTCRAVFGA
jgi:2-polyprenyl-6-methoxyphenol hydroxylase-like FAD-dependent oxidoreductase